MPHAYPEALITESVQAARRRYGSRDSMARLVDGLEGGDVGAERVDAAQHLS